MVTAVPVAPQALVETQAAVAAKEGSFRAVIAPVVSMAAVVVVEIREGPVAQQEALLVAVEVAAGLEQQTPVLVDREALRVGEMVLRLLLIRFLMGRLVVAHPLRLPVVVAVAAGIDWLITRVAVAVAVVGVQLAMRAMQATPVAQLTLQQLIAWR